jgi:hypothetical protein
MSLFQKQLAHKDDGQSNIKPDHPRKRLKFWPYIDFEGVMAR